jgi:DNA uptake protein ComE-like DNA-binding protein
MWWKLLFVVRFSRKQQYALFFYVCMAALSIALNSDSSFSIPDVSAVHQNRFTDLNSADSATLEALPGIGPVLAARIVKYRSRVGCFHATDEILQVYGVSHDWYMKMKTKLITSTCNNRRLMSQNHNKHKKHFDYKSQPFRYHLIRPHEKLDLNIVDSAEISSFHLIPDFMLSRVLKERNKLKCFTSWIQLERIWGMETHWLDSLHTWTILGPCQNSAPEPTHSKRFQVFTPVQINLADETELMRIPGMSKGLAKRILQYRDKLGFYLHHQQLYEIYKSPEPDEWAEILPYMQFDRNDNLPFLLVNEMDIKSLAQHPYVGFSLARRIVHYREQHGKFASVESLTKIYGVKPETWEKITPYIQLDATRSTTPQDH